MQSNLTHFDRYNLTGLDRYNLTHLDRNNLTHLDGYNLTVYRHSLCITFHVNLCPIYIYCEQQNIFNILLMYKLELLSKVNGNNNY